MVDKERIVKNFSKSALTYDDHAHIQRRLARELLGMTGRDAPENILEIGCGTGNYAGALRERFKNARLKAIDISEKMIEVAKGKLTGKGIEFIVGDAEDLELGERFDLITANAAFQWFRDLDAALAKFRNMLKAGGTILFSAFGPGTFHELSESLKSLMPEISIATAFFPGEDELRRIMTKHFKGAELRKTVYREEYDSLIDLLNEIKHTGVTGSGIAAKGAFTPRVLKELEKAYIDKFGRVAATYEIFLCRAYR